MALTPGSRLGPYEVTALLGEGGMGQVYRATDTNLKRQVAIKVLPAELAADADRLARFQREAEVLAALNHPHIAQIFGLEKSADVTALVMELVEGDDLSQRIARGAIPIDEALPIAKQIAEAFEAAHEQGIIHRDLKPANIKVRSDGTVKVLDFGLAKAFDTGTGKAGGAGRADLSASPTLTSPAMMTGVGVILGTAAYMAPEQARGTTLDKRADLWAFGVVLYEMLTGMRLFEGATVSDTIAAVLKAEPDWNALPPATPAAIRRLLRRCLEKDRKRRLPDAADARLEIDEALATPSDEARGAVSSVEPRRRVVAVAGVALVMGAAVTALTLAALPSTRRVPPASTPSVTRLLMGVEPAELLLGGPGTNVQARPTRTAIAWSPDGRTLVFGGGRGGMAQLYARRLDQLQATPLAGTDGAVAPFFSPDGATVGFWAAGALKKVALSGGPAVTICEAPMIGRATWADDGVIYFDASEFSQRTGISSVPAGGGRAQPLAEPDASTGEYSYRLPHALPGGQALLFTMVRGNQQWADAQILVRSLATGAQTVLTDGADARYVRPGYLAFVRQGALLAAPFDVNGLRLSGGAVGVVDRVMQAINAPAASLDTGAAQFDVSSTGSLAYASGGALAEDLRSLVWVDRTGALNPINLSPRVYWGPRLAPDGQRVGYYMRGTDQRVWISDLRTNASTPVTERGNPSYIVWSPDAVRVAFAESGNLFWRRADGGGVAERLTAGPIPQRLPSSWSPDGKTLLIVERNPSSGDDIWLLPMGQGAAPPRPWLNTRFAEAHPDWSPDGRWIAYDSNEPGRPEVYVQPYPGPGARYVVSQGGGNSPAWSRDGRELFYLAPGADGQVAMMATAVTTNREFSTGTPQKLFQGHFVASAASRSYDVAPDGRRFIMVQRREQVPLPVSHVVIVQNWTEELKRLTPAK